MQKVNKSLLVLLLICILEAITIGFLIKDNLTTPVTPPDVPKIEIVRDSIIRDSIFIVNERIKKEIVYIEKQFEEDSANIMSASDSVLFDSFSRYIEDYNNK